MNFQPHNLAIDKYEILQINNGAEQEILLNHNDLTKKLLFKKNQIITEIELKKLPKQKIAGIEFNINLFAPMANDRYFLDEKGERFYLNFYGNFKEYSNLSIIDEWLGIKVSFFTNSLKNILIYPVYTISLSEDGVEKTYQGSCLLFYNNIDSKNLKSDIILSVEEL